MDSSTVYIVVVMCVWISAGVKAAFDQMKFFKAYKEMVDPTLPLSPIESGIAQNPFMLMKQRIKITLK